MSSTSSNTGEFTYNELMEQYVKATRLIEHLKSQRNRSKRAFDKAMDLVLKYDPCIAELEAVIDQLIEAGEKMFTAVIAAAGSYDEGMREWDKIVNDWKEGER
jgi:hypothetical protein